MMEMLFNEQADNNKEVEAYSGKTPNGRAFQKEIRNIGGDDDK